MKLIFKKDKYGIYSLKTYDNHECYVILSPTWNNQLPSSEDVSDLTKFTENNKKRNVQIDLDNKDDELQILFLALALRSNFGLKPVSYIHKPTINTGYLTVYVDNNNQIIVLDDDGYEIDPYPYLPKEFVQIFGE